MRLLLPLGLLLVGCRGSENPMPLEVGNSWKYAVSTQFQQYLADVRVIRETSVGGHPGFVLAGATGESRVAWVDGTLIAERIANTRFVPAIPILVDTAERSRSHWKGQVQGNWGKFEGTAVLNQVASEELIGGLKTRVIKAELTILNPKGKSIRLQTFFQPGVGIAEQRQWTGSNAVVTVERQS